MSKTNDTERDRAEQAYAESLTPGAVREYAAKRTAKKYVVVLRTECMMYVEVEAISPQEAKKLARAGEYEPIGEWEALDYDALRVSRVRER